VQLLHFCPTRGRPRTFPNSMARLPGDYLRAMTDYAGSGEGTTGMVVNIVVESQLRFAGVADGLSNCLMLGEKRMNVTLLSGPQDDDDQGYTAGFDKDTVRGYGSVPLPDITDSGAASVGRFGSSHVGGFNAVLGDGSVRFVPYTVSRLTFNRLGQRADGEPLGNDY
jgi:hypothetical protein